MTKSRKLKKIEEEIELCEECKLNKHGKAVPGEGNPDADILFVGEAPGRTEAATGRPFIGRSGKLLRESIKTVGLSENEVFITSPVKYLPDYVTPKEKDIEHGMIHLSKQIDIIDPKIIVLLGSVAARGVLGEKLMVSKVHGQVIERDSRKYFISYHPSAAIRFAKVKVEFLKDIEKLRKLLKH